MYAGNCSFDVISISWSEILTHTAPISGEVFSNSVITATDGAAADTSSARPDQSVCLLSGSGGKPKIAVDTSLSMPSVIPVGGRSDAVGGKERTSGLVLLCLMFFLSSSPSNSCITFLCLSSSGLFSRFSF